MTSGTYRDELGRVWWWWQEPSKDPRESRVLETRTLIGIARPA